MSIAERFWRKVKRASPEACWLWLAARDRDGYGVIGRDGRQWRANRLAWTLVEGEIPEGLKVLHKCDNPPCCNPSHLFLGTNAENCADMVSKGRQTRGERNGRAKLTDHDVIDIRTLHAFGAMRSELARSYGVTHPMIRRICNGEAWRHVP